MKVLKMILQQIPTFSVTLPHPNDSFKHFSTQTTSLVLASQSVAKAHQHQLLCIPHKKLTLLQGIKKKIASSSTSLMNILSFLEKTLIHVSLLIGGEVAAHNFLLYIDLSDIFSIPGKSCIHLLLGLHFLTGPT